MAVRKRGNKFMADFMVAGVRYREHFPTAEAAERWEEDTRIALKRGAELPPPPAASVGGSDRGTIKEVFRSAKVLHWEKLKSSETTVRVAQLYLNWVGEKSTPAEALSLTKIRQYVEYLITVKKVKNSTINYHLSMICVLLKYANMPRPEDLPWQKRQAGRIRYMTEQEVDLVIQTLTLWGENKIRDLFIFLVDTGARPKAEAMALRWTNFRDRFVTFEDTKNGTTRTLPMTKRAQEAVERQRMSNQDGPWRGIGYNRVNKVWNNIRSHIPSLDDTVVYTARHTCASWQVIAGIDLRRVMMWMGHTDIKTTLNYAHLSPQHLMDNVAALESIRSPNLTVISKSV